MECVHCRGTNPDGSAWCGQCYQPFPGPDPSVPDQAVAEFRQRRRTVGVKGALGRTASVTLEPTAGGHLYYLEPGGERRAIVAKTGDRHAVVDMTDTPLFSVERYRAVDSPALVVFDPEGEPLAVFLRDGSRTEIRDGTGAPVAMMGPEGERVDIVETGRHMVGFVFRQDIDLGDVIDDLWGLAIFEEPMVLDRRALAAAPLVARLLSRRRPRRKPPAAMTLDTAIPALGGSVDWLDGALRLLLR